MALSACVSARGSLSGESGKSCERHRSHCSDCALTESYFSHYALTTVPSPSPVSGVNFLALHERARPTDAQGVCVCVWIRGHLAEDNHIADVVARAVVWVKKLPQQCQNNVLMFCHALDSVLSSESFQHVV